VVKRLFLAGAIVNAVAIIAGTGIGAKSRQWSGGRSFCTSKSHILRRLYGCSWSEGVIALISYFAGTALNSPPIITCMSATGGLLIVAIGVNLLDLKKISVGSLLPAMIVAAVVK
jgi:uncharacterized membrane protein YqgA involved in biofilm formation